MNNTLKAVERAVEGGWVPFSYEEPLSLNLVAQKAILLDPAFWQALGRVEGWNLLQYSPWAIRDSEGDFVEEKVPEYIVHMHRLIDHLADGGTIEQFFTNLLTSDV
jgi:hypothetical protein